MKKVYDIHYGIGKSKYVVSYHDGIKKHSDQSDFYDCRIFKNRKELNKFVVSLIMDGYTNLLLMKK